MRCEFDRFKGLEDAGAEIALLFPGFAWIGRIIGLEVDGVGRSVDGLVASFAGLAAGTTVVSAVGFAALPKTCTESLAEISRPGEPLQALVAGVGNMAGQGGVLT